MLLTLCCRWNIDWPYHSKFSVGHYLFYQSVEFLESQTMVTNFRSALKLLHCWDRYAKPSSYLHRSWRPANCCWPKVSEAKRLPCCPYFCWNDCRYCIKKNTVTHFCTVLQSFSWYPSVGAQLTRSRSIGAEGFFATGLDAGLRAVFNYIHGDTGGFFTGYVSEQSSTVQ